MPIAQAYNRRINAWVKYDFKAGQGFRAFDVKQREPMKPFIGVPIKGKRK